nr:DoxX family protein [uncultured Allomuricauda sp.]
MGKSIKERMLSISMGVVYFWFGALKFIPNLSPAEDLAKSTIHHLTFGLIPDEVSIILLAFWEVGLGFLFVLGLFRRQVVILALIHMVCTFTPLLFFPNDVFGEEPLSLTLVGQYIIKNLIIIAVLLSIYERKSVTEKQEMLSRNNSKDYSPRILISRYLFKKG